MAQTIDPFVQQFELHRPYLRGVAYRMLGSFDDAEDAVQDAWLRAATAGTDGIENMRAWLTTIVSRVCLNMLRARKTHKEESIELHMPDPIIAPPAEDPETQAVLADSVSFALFLVLETLSPDERLAFILHDMFGVPFDEIAQTLDKSPEAARKLASRARTRVRAGAPHSDSPRSERAVVDAFLRAAQTGDIEGLMHVLHPDVVLRNDIRADRPMVIRQGADSVARGASAFQAARTISGYRATINGAPGAIALINGELASVAAFTVANGRIVAMDVLSDRARLARIDPLVLESLPREEPFTASRSPALRSDS
ncbi:MAG: sigma-70 family RNA polymerase sigma factor [Thermomicrobiales bacterium]|nr:sigma-70 family RNA polymerase sigma factor [Thermomicrobiales bacterium]MCO5223005.1 sigma-70 family RNA polymerase sigma factor [Thermomicrobiales bacterium]